MIYLKPICLLFAIVYTFSNIAKVYLKQEVGESQMWLMGLGITGFVYLQFLS